MPNTLNLLISPDDWETIQDQLLVLLDKMEAEYEKHDSSHGKMFCMHSDFFYLPNLGLNCYLDITVLACDLNIVSHTGESPLSSKRIALAPLFEPLIPPERLGSGTQTHPERTRWIRNTRSKVENGEFGL